MIGKQSQKKKYPLVNWADGMPVNKGHFTQQEDHFTDRLCEYQSFHLNRNTYGLLPFKKGEPVSGDFSITELVTGTLEVRLKRCHALTSGGYLIDYDAGEDDELTASFHIPTEEEEEKDKRWDVILMADPFEHLPSGIPNEKEISPRQPNALPKYALSVLPSGQTDGSELGRHFLLIGRLRKNGNRCEVDGNFIPPCTSMSSHPDLKGYYTKFGQLVDSIEKASFDILAKVENAEKQTSLATNIGMLCRHVMLFISDIYFSFRNEGLNSTCKCNRILINNLFKFFVWREVSKSFTRSIIEFIFNPLNLFVGYFTKVLTLWDILPDKPVGVFIGTTFP